jgi:hypothetical protein
LTHSLLTAVIECHYWISVCAWLTSGAHRAQAAKASAES